MSINLISNSFSEKRVLNYRHNEVISVARLLGFCFQKYRKPIMHNFIISVFTWGGGADTRVRKKKKKKKKKASVSIKKYVSNETSSVTWIDSNCFFSKNKLPFIFCFSVTWIEANCFSVIFHFLIAPAGFWPLPRRHPSIPRLYTYKDNKENLLKK